MASSMLINASPASATAFTQQGVSLRSVRKQYGAVVAVDNLSLDIAPGSYCCLLGPSGCGKTSTLRMIAGHEDATSGDILIGDQRVNDLPPAQRNTAMMFQNYALFPHKTVWQNVEFGLKMRKVSTEERQRRVGEILELVGLSAFGQRRPHALSGGQQQRVALARALVTRPQVLMLDEPLSALDESMRVRMRGELRKLQRQFGITFIQVTHVQEEAFSLSDQIVVMDHGHIDQIGSPEAIFARPASQFVARFVGDNNILPGKVTRTDPSRSVIELEAPGMGVILCTGSDAILGSEAAASIRADQLQIEPLRNEPMTGSGANFLTARVGFVEFTGYVMRVSLLVEATGQELLYKVRITDYKVQPLQEGQTVGIRWSPEDCVFLSH